MQQEKEGPNFEYSWLKSKSIPAAVACQYVQTTKGQSQNQRSGLK